MLRTLTAATLAASLSTAALAGGHLQEMSLDPNHSTVQFTWTHGGFSTTFGIFFDVEGTIQYDAEEPANSTVMVEFPLSNMQVDEDLRGHLASGDFFNGLDDKMVTFTSTSIEVTGEDTANITGDLMVNGETNEVVLAATFNGSGAGPMGGEIFGFDATTTLLRSNYGVGAFTPFVSDELAVEISIEASPAS
ncbi:MAG: YceI family protein [Shimia sp.]